jgi:hypothetical protein
VFNVNYENMKFINLETLIINFTKFITMTKILTRINDANKITTTSVLALTAILTLSLMTTNFSMNAYADHDPVDDLSDGWTVENYTSPLSVHTDGVWIVAGSTETVEQITKQSVPTAYISDFNMTTKVYTASLSASGDDDYIGFVLGYDPGDFSNETADYLLIDWKEDFQDTVDAGTFPGDCAVAVPPSFEGLALSRVSGVPDPDEIWSHSDLGCGDLTGSVEELARATNLGGDGWNSTQTYTFDFLLKSDKIQIWVDGVLEFEVEDDFSDIDGRFGFYTFSQGNAHFGNLVCHSGCSPGFWKTHTDINKYPNAWPATAYDPDLKFEDVFFLVELPNPYGEETTLEEALNAKGGKKVSQLLRFATATLLNASHGDIEPESDFADPQDIIDLVNLVNWNDKNSIKDAIQELAPLTNLGCPISGQET